RIGKEGTAFIDDDDADGKIAVKPQPQAAHMRTVSELPDCLLDAAPRLLGHLTKLAVDDVRDSHEGNGRSSSHILHCRWSRGAIGPSWAFISPRPLTASRRVHRPIRPWP